MKFAKIFSSAIMACGLLFCSTSFAKEPAASETKLATKVQNSTDNKQRLNALIAHYAKINKVPVKMAHAIIHTESNYNIMAHGKAGEIGLMQIMPTTARSLGFKGPLTDLYCPETNLKFGMQYLAKACKIAKGNTCRTVLKYNAGYHAKKMNPVSRRYCKKVKSFLASFKLHLPIS